VVHSFNFFCISHGSQGHSGFVEMPWGKVLESSHINFVVNMLIVEDREGIIDPFSCRRELAFRGDDEDFIGSRGAFDVKAPRLFKYHVINHCCLNISAGITREWDIESLVLEIADRDSRYALQEGVVVAEESRVNFWS